MSDSLDYYLLTGPAGVLVEEFTRDADGATTGLKAAIWSVAGPRWRAAASFGLLMRTDKAQLARATPVARAAAADAFRQFGGGDLPAEDELRAELTDFAPLASAPPLRLGPSGDANRHYRVLFAKDPRPEPPAGLASGSRRIGADAYSWKLRRVGNGIGWALDVTAGLAGPPGTVEPLLRELTAALRAHGLIPVTTERFS
ncbi:MAG TPA: hypothetical protein VFW27_31535 [Actinoplanes sp.]|nr:hypothetical protein [Actinoplanes sp.]